MAYSLTSTFDSGSQVSGESASSYHLHHHSSLLSTLSFLSPFFVVGAHWGGSLAAQALFEPPLSLGSLPAPTSALSRIPARAPQARRGGPASRTTVAARATGVGMGCKQGEPGFLPGVFPQNRHFLVPRNFPGEANVHEGRRQTP